MTYTTKLLIIAATAVLLVCGCVQLPGAHGKSYHGSFLDADQVKFYEADANKKEETIRQNPSDANTLSMLALDYSLLGRHNDAERTILKAVSLEPANYRIRSEAGMILSGDGRHKEAASQYEEAVRLRPDYYLPLEGLVDEYIALGRYDDALVKSNLAVSLAPDNFVPHHDLAVAYHRLGKNAEAATEFAEAKRLLVAEQKRNLAEKEEDVRSRPDDVEAHFMLAYAYGDIGNYSGELAEYKEILTIKPDDKSVGKNLGDVYVELGQYQDAVKAYTDFINRFSTVAQDATIRPNPLDESSTFGDMFGGRRAVPGAHAGLGTAYAYLKQYDDAEREYKIAMGGIRVDEVELRTELGNMYAEMGRNDDARKQYETAIRIDEYGGYEPHIHLAKLYVKMGRLQDAVKEYKKAVKAIPELPEAHAGLCRTYLKLGDERSAREELDEVMTLDKEQGEKLRAALKL